MSLEVRNTNSIVTRPFGETQSKAMRTYAQSGQYHTGIVESRVGLRLAILYKLVYYLLQVTCFPSCSPKT